MKDKKLKKIYTDEFIAWLDKYIYSNRVFSLKDMRAGFINHPIELELFIDSIVKKYK